MHPFWVCKLEHFFSSHPADWLSISCVPACVLDGIYIVCSTGDLSGQDRVPVLREPMFWEKRWLISHQTHRSYIASGLRVGLVKYQNQASVVLMFGCASPSDPVLDLVYCSLRSWCLPNRHSPRHRLKPPHLLPEGSTLKRGRQWPGLGLLGAPQVHTGISFWLNSAENILDFRVSASQPWPLLAVSYVPSDPVGDAWLGGGKGQSG